MTDREKAIVMAHTGICMLAGEKFGVFHAYIEDIMGRPVYTHELAIQSISDEIKKKSRDDFMELCKEEQEPCDDAISRQAAIEAFQMFREYESNRSNKEWVDRIETVLNQLPPVTSKQKTGNLVRWYEEVKHSKCTEYIPHCKCSECGEEYDPHSSQFIKYCNECGAKMDEPQESEG